MTAVEVRDVSVPAWQGGFGRLWTAAVLSSFEGALRTAGLPLLAGAFFVLPVVLLIPALQPDVPVVEPDDGTTVRVTS